MEDTRITREKLMQDFEAVVSDTEQLLKSLASASGDKVQAVRAEIERNLSRARERLAALEGDALERGRAAAKATDDYVRSNPWQSIAIVAAVSAAIGVVLGLLLNRR